MSKEGLEQFMVQMAESEALQARIGEEIDAESLVALGAEHGFEFSVEDLQESAELSDDELDGVAGGTYEVLPSLDVPTNISFTALTIDTSRIEFKRRQLKLTQREFKKTRIQSIPE